jgi:hypothetical protein
MSREYRIIYFTPDPFLGGRIPVGAYVSTGEDVIVMKSDCRAVNGPQAKLLVRSALRDIAAAGVHRLPTGVGPHFTLGECRTVPSGVESAEVWLKALLDAP